MPGKFTRSRNGCQACRSIKLKCDEGKPQCRRCSAKGIQCDYAVQLRWASGAKRGGKAAGGKTIMRVSGKVGMRGKARAAPISGLLTPTVSAPAQVSPAPTPAQYSPQTQLAPVQSAQWNSVPQFNSSLQSIPQYNSPLQGIPPFGAPLSDESFASFMSMFNGGPMFPGMAPFDAFPPVNHAIPSATFLSHISLESLNLPLPLPRRLVDSSSNMELFEFYVRETANLLTPTKESRFFKNPFKILISQMAMESDTLLNILLAFSANHRSQMTCQIEDLDASSSDDDNTGKMPVEEELPPAIQNILSPLPSLNNKSNTQTFVRGLLSKTVNNLVKKLQNSTQRTSDTTLATVLMLTLFDIFFGDKSRSWREHLDGARNLFAERLKQTNADGGRDDLTIILPFDTQISTNFLFWWFSYIDIVAALSSVSPVSSITTGSPGSPDPLASPIFSYRFPNMCKSQTDLEYLREKRETFDDIERGIGVDPKVLSLMGDISVLVYFHDDSDTSPPSQSTLVKALELDHEMLEYIRISELERDSIMSRYKDGCPDELIDKFNAYKILRAMNKVFAFSGLLQLKRRILRIPLSSSIIKEILHDITALIEKYIPVESSTTSCIIFCLFCCGCDLIDPDMAQYRHIYLDRINQLSKIGVSSTKIAKSIMMECWDDKKNWWDILLEKNLDLTFAI
ncbi:hypothetical protein DAKH74_042950 [Maudiozyma humilis]|uniref:Zn(2)-C6 fungal-type domain-containing protein n=1 Tax=Maudiozyma humilis TaxID=51915 RepID=A0AAV5S4N9_MAUHU|nr:hypothetical protein DAKH74_042950 [Kazachstania humilis]